VSEFSYRPAVVYGAVLGVDAADTNKVAKVDQVEKGEKTQESEQ
jgi:hypothetical protein